MRFLFVLLMSFATAAGVIWAGSVGIGPIVIVKEWEHQIPLLLGAPWRETISDPGLHWRIPIIEEMVVLDKRLRILDAEPVEMQIESERLEVDYYAVWRIRDPLVFRRSFPTGAGSAEMVIRRQLKSAVGAAVGKMSLQQLLSRSELTDELGEKVSKNLAAKGVEVLDVRINRTELPQEAKTAAYDQMREQRRAISRQYRASGKREAREILASAERESRTLLARAHSEAEVVRGEGDAKAAAIYAAAFGEDPEFYGFVRSLEAYRNTLGDRTTLVLPPDHDFFRYFDPRIQDGDRIRSNGETKSHP
jgi:membrane protease subunit HflC